MTFYQKNYCLLSFLFHIGHDLYLLGYDALIFFFFLFLHSIFTDQKLTSQVHEIVGRINGRFGTLTAVPIHHLVCL